MIIKTISSEIIINGFSLSIFYDSLDQILINFIADTALTVQYVFQKFHLIIIKLIATSTSSKLYIVSRFNEIVIIIVKMCFIRCQG